MVLAWHGRGREVNALREAVGNGVISRTEGVCLGQQGVMVRGN